jgi:hypothetical protein
MSTVSTLLHIGVPKTGTTAVQAALTDLLARSGEASGFTMPGTPAEQARAALSVIGAGLGWRKDEKAASSTHWPRLAEQVRAATGTVVVSSEFLCEASPPVIRQILDDLGETRVVVTLRPLGRILPSAWQQYLKSGHQLPYHKWLKAVLADPPKHTVTPSFWRRHDHGAVIGRWAAEVGPERMTVVVLDESDRGLVMRTFDELLGLPVGTLVESPDRGANRSMSAAEAELFRRLNLVLRGTSVSWVDYAHLVRYGAVLRTVERYVPPPGAAKLATPAWALERATELGARYVSEIDALRPAGLNVVGTLETLATPVPPAAQDEPEAPQTVPIDVAVEAILGIVGRATVGSRYFPEEEADATEGLPGSEPVPARKLPADRLTSRELAGLLTGRARKRLRRQVSGLPVVRHHQRAGGFPGDDASDQLPPG